MNGSGHIPPEDLNFHYNREERTSSMSEEARRQLYEPRKKVVINRRHMLVLIDMLLIVVALISVNAYRSGMGKARNIAGCDMELTGFIYDERALVSLKISVRNPKAVPDTVIARFTLAGEELEVREILPKGEDSVRIVRAEFPLSPDKERLVTVDVILGEKEQRLEKELTRE